MGRCGTTPNRDGDAKIATMVLDGVDGAGVCIVFANTGALGFTVIPSNIGKP